MRELLLEFLETVDEPVRSILAEVILAEQRTIDMERPRVRAEIRDIIDKHVRREEVAGGGGAL
ncbi:MAG: hypothetical protein U0V56_08230 [Actinomycetota bacterium]